MKFKENAIKPGVVIHCPKEEDAEALMKYLESIGYINVYYMVDKHSTYRELTCYKMCRTHNGSLTTECSTMRYYRDDCCYPITEFSDLIEPDEPQMSAVEVLEWLEKYGGTQVSEKVFGFDLNGDAPGADNILERYCPQDIIDKITAYEAAKKAPEPVEVERVDICRIIQIQDNGVKKCTYEEELPDNDGYATTENILKKYISEHEGRYIAVMEGICRVKEDK